MPKIIYNSMSFLHMYISANISKIFSPLKTVDDLNKKGLAEIMANPLKIIPFIRTKGQDQTTDTGIFSQS
jgi:hypothetical protein